jgi:hypothetical protein
MKKMASKKPKITDPNTTPNPSPSQIWKSNKPYGGSTESWRAWGSDNPNRISNAARTMRTPKAKRTEVEGETTAEWQARRPKGGTRGVAAPHPEWVAWGKSKPGNASRAAKTMAAQRKPATAKKATAKRAGKKK